MRTNTGNKADVDVLRVTVIGGGPVALIFAALVADRLPDTAVRIRIYDHRWRGTHDGRVEWKPPQEGNRRRQQVVTIQSRQYTMMPRELFEHVFPRGVCGTVWPIGSDSVGGLAPLNIRIADLEDGLLDWNHRNASVDLVPLRFDAREHLGTLRGEHLVVVCDGAGSQTRDALKIFGRPNTGAFCRGGRQLEDVVLGLRVRSRLRAGEAVVLTVAQSRFLLNPGFDGEGILNMRLTDAEALEAGGVNPLRPDRIRPCTQADPCLPEHRFPSGPADPAAPGPTVFAPSRLGTGSTLWPRIVDGLRLFDVDLPDLKSITAFRLSMVERPRFTGVLSHQTAAGPATIAALLGDAAISVHFWPGRGLNTGIGSAAALADDVVGRWRGKTFREADFATFEARMAHLQYRNQVRGFYGSMRVDDTTGQVTPIRDLIDRSYSAGIPGGDRRTHYRAVMSQRLEAVRDSLQGRMPGGLPDLGVLEDRLDRVAPETVAALAASGPWDTYRPGGPEVDLGLAVDLTAGWSDLLRVSARALRPDSAEPCPTPADLVAPAARCPRLNTEGIGARR